jgi:hypothetical protein
MPFVPRRPIAAFLLAGLALALPGCGGGQAAPATMNGSYAEAGKSAAQILADAQRAVLSVRTFHVAGAIRRASDDLKIDLHFAGTKGAYGSIEYAGVPFNMVRIGPAVYFKAPAAFYAKAGMAGQVTHTIAGRWIKAGAQGPGFSKFANFMSTGQFFRSILGSAASAGMVKVPGVRIIGGTPAVALSDLRNGARLYVAARGPALPLRIDGPYGSGSMNIVGYGQPVTLTAPNGALDLSGIKA